MGHASVTITLDRYGHLLPGGSGGSTSSPQRLLRSGSLIADDPELVPTVPTPPAWSSPPTPSEIADWALEFRATYRAFNLSLPLLLHPGLPLLETYQRVFGQGPETPVVIRRNDGTVQSELSFREILSDVAAVRGGGLRGDVLTFTAMHGVVRLGDSLSLAGLSGRTEPLLQFARHLRNACAHGNRWHFLGGEPKLPAALRGSALDNSLHGTQAIMGWLGPGDYLDFLDDLAELLRRLPDA